MLTSVLTDVSAATVTCTLRLHLYSESIFALTCTYDQVPVLLKCHLKLNVTGSEKTDHFVINQFVQYGPKELPRSRSRDFAISMPRCSMVS